MGCKKKSQVPTWSFGHSSWPTPQSQQVQASCTCFQWTCLSERYIFQGYVSWRTRRAESSQGCRRADFWYAELRMTLIVNNCGIQQTKQTEALLLQQIYGGICQLRGLHDKKIIIMIVALIRLSIHTRAVWLWLERWSRHCIIFVKEVNCFSCTTEQSSYSTNIIQARKFCGYVLPLPLYCTCFS